jgi:hypothetical protein
MLNISHMAVSRAMTLLELPEDVQDRVSAGELAASVAVEVAKLEDPAEQREVAARVVAEGLNRADAVELVRQVASKPRAGGSKASKGRGASKGKVKLQSVYRFKTEPGIRITAERSKGIDPVALVAALEEATRQAREKLEPAEQGGEQVAA